ncbi:MAG: D-glycero-beta-D-manno-heptose 1-phosphate adenylyltransferase [Thermodesulfobacteriota bacterium]
MKKVLSLKRLTEELAPLRKKGRRIVFTNGCFDIIHAGHVRYLTRARALGDVLVVGLNSDSSVRSVKGPSRPIVPEKERAEVLAALAPVDYVVLFSEPTPLRLIEAIAPDVLVKGSDWAAGEIVGAEAVKKRGGRVARVRLVKGRSTTNIIKRILELHKK